MRSAKWITRIALVSLLAFSIAESLVSAIPSGVVEKSAEVRVSTFGTMPDGKEVKLYALKNSHGMEARITDYGATLVSLKTADRSGKFADVVLGYSDLAGYMRGHDYFGATIGRYGNRIDKGTFSLNGQTYHLAVNNGVNHLHGGKMGYDRVLWQARPVGGSSIQFSYLSKDGEENYPGDLQVSVVYTITENNELKIQYRAEEGAGKDTIVNLTNHSYFNLTGDPSKTILNHELLLNASRFTPTDAGQIPTGEVRSVKGTPFNFEKLTAIGARIDQPDEQLKLGKGYDHNWVIDRINPGLAKAAVVYEPTTGRVMEVYTTEPAIQFYSGNNLNGTQIGKSDIAYAFRTGMALETQHFPDSPNHPDFPSTTLKAGHRYESTTVYRFSAR